MRWEGHVTRMWEMRKTYKIFWLETWRSRLRWQDNIKTDLRKVVHEDVNWTHLIQVGVK